MQWTVECDQGHELARAAMTRTRETGNALAVQTELQRLIREHGAESGQFAGFAFELGAAFVSPSP